MNYKYETSRLCLKILTDQPEYALQALDFYDRNRAVFEPCEPVRPKNFYTENYHATLLHCEHQLFLNLQDIRYWIYEKTNLKRIIGTVCFHNILRLEHQRCSIIGYKLDETFWHLGMAKEAISFLISRIFQELDLHRIEAYVMPENLNSIYLLDSLGFQKEGLCRQVVKIQGKWTDHFLYSLINEESREGSLSSETPRFF